jgi:signal transduction histidine kinase
MKSEFVSIVSHQLRTPLSALKWSLDLLRGKRLGDLNKKQKEYFDIINDSSIKMIKLVNDLLNVNRIEQGRLSVRPREFSLSELARGVVRELNVLAEVHSVKIKFEEGKEVSNVFADPDRIRMVIQNLIDNAIKYSRKEGGIVEISVKEDEKNKKMIKVSVKDNGMGIPGFMQKQVFGKFFRGKNLIKQKVEGTGLGLFIAKGIIEFSKGEIDFSSQEKKGSTFWFTIPIANKNKK